MERPAIDILPYEAIPAQCEPYEAAVLGAAETLAAFLRDRLPGAGVEHIGSTAVAGCAGNGILDLMVLCPAGKLDDIRQCIDELGFQHQSTRDPFPEERPMRTGAFEYSGRRYLVHVHLLSADSTEAEELRYFRDCLRADRELRAAYVAFKKKVLGKGVQDPAEYAEQKGEFMRQCLGR